MFARLAEKVRKKKCQHLIVSARADAIGGFIKAPVRGKRRKSDGKGLQADEREIAGKNHMKTR